MSQCVRPRSTSSDPCCQMRNLAVCQSSIGRHLQVDVIHRLDEQTVMRFAAHDGRACFAPLQHSFNGIESQTAFLLLLAVALETSALQQWPHMLLKLLENIHVSFIRPDSR